MQDIEEVVRAKCDFCVSDHRASQLQLVHSDWHDLRSAEDFLIFVHCYPESPQQLMSNFMGSIWGPRACHSRSKDHDNGTDS